MALSAPRVVLWQGIPEPMPAVEAEASDTYYRGAILLLLASGYAGVPSDTAALVGAGIFTGRAANGVQDYALVVAGGAHPQIVVERGIVRLPLSGVAQANVGDKCYISDDQSMTLSAGSKTVFYWVLAWESGYVWVDLRNPCLL